MSQAHNYQLYSKDNGGRITRAHRVIQMDSEDLQSYTHHEKLMGWPESIVYWRVMGDKSCVGISPDSEAAFKAVSSLETTEVR